MAHQNPKAKGSAFERSVCQRLSLWASDGAREDVFWRSSISGGRATLGSRKARGTKFTAQAGDISAIHPLGHPLLKLFFIECKHLRRLQLDLALYGYKGFLEKLWIKPSKQAAAIRREPLCIVKENRRAELVLTTPKGGRWLQECRVRTGDFPGVATLHQVGMRVYRFDELVGGLSYEELTKVAERMTRSRKRQRLE